MEAGGAAEPAGAACLRVRTGAGLRHPAVGGAFKGSGWEGFPTRTGDISLGPGSRMVVVGGVQHQCGEK